MMKKIKDVNLEALSPSLDCSPETLSKLKQAIPEVNKYIALGGPFSFMWIVLIRLCVYYQIIHDPRILADHPVFKMC